MRARGAGQRRRPSHRASKVLIALACFLGAFALVVAFSYQRVLRWLVIDAALERGLRIDPGTLEASPGHVRLGNTRFSLQGVPSIAARAGTIDIELQGLKPVSVEVRGTRIELTGSLDKVQSELRSWEAAHSLHGCAGAC